MRPLVFCLGLLAATGSARAQHHTISAAGLETVHLCDPLTRVDSLFAHALDTLIVGEADTRWPARVVHLDDHRFVLFESSWADTARVWRISTTSPQYQTHRGVHVDMPLSTFKRGGEDLTMHFPEGRVVLGINRDSVSALLDDSTSALLQEHPSDTWKLVSGAGHITQLFVSGSCRRPAH